MIKEFVGYILGVFNEVFNFGLEIINILLNIIEWLLSPFNFSPTPGFLSDVAAFEAVVIAIAIPLSFEIVSRISERYKSEVITNRFFEEWEVKGLPYLLILNILLAITLRFCADTDPTHENWKILAWVTFIGFIGIVIILVLFINKLKKYMTDTEFILDQLFNDAEKLLK